MRKIITYGLYPLLLAIIITVIILAIGFKADYKLVYGISTLLLVAVLLLIETIFPLKKEWKMTKQSFVRDLMYILIDAPIIGLTKAGFGLLAIGYSQIHKGHFSKAPVIMSTIVFLLVFEFLQYWYHRLSHNNKGTIGKFLWRVHLAHHLPNKVYVVMHAVFNPINAFITVAIIQTPLMLLGITPEAALAATMLIDLQSLVSHFNVNIKAGFLNYIFIGTETHRFHHSANPGEAKNYGNTLAIWDLVFGTFYYKPKHVPSNLGVDKPKDYPQSENIMEILAFPFKP
jgi:sterol desaturase/sphingolipid hydroxylase (fatty acid hydroxylase superfamily)